MVLYHHSIGNFLNQQINTFHTNLRAVEKLDRLPLRRVPDEDPTKIGKSGIPFEWYFFLRTTTRTGVVW